MIDQGKNTACKIGTFGKLPTRERMFVPLQN